MPAFLRDMAHTIPMLLEADREAHHPARPKGSVGRHCLEQGSTEGCTGENVDLPSPSKPPKQRPPEGKEQVVIGDHEPAAPPASASASPPPATAECDAELEIIKEGMDKLLSPLWGRDVEGGLGPFLHRCRSDGVSLVVLLDEQLAELPVEASSALDGLPAVARDLSLHILSHRLRAAADANFEVSNAQMRYVADPLLEDPAKDDPGVTAAPSPPPKRRGEKPRPNSGGGTGAGSTTRKSILQTLRQSIGVGDTGSSGSKVKVSTWKGVAGDHHAPGVREWQSLVSGEPSVALGDRRGKGGFLYYGPGRCPSMFPPANLVGLNVNCQAVILVDRAHNDVSHLRESKQNSVKSKSQMELERAAQVAALFSLAGSQSVALNMWPTTFRDNRRMVCTLFRRWDEAGSTLGRAVTAMRTDTSLKPHARLCTVLYGLPTLKYSS